MRSVATTAAVAFGLLLLLDIPWLYFISRPFGDVVRSIQGSPLQVRYLAAVVVYIGLTYLVLQTKTPLDAFLAGAATYAVYDFTNVATLSKYPYWIAAADTVWGGTLFAATRYLLNMLGY